MLHHVLKSIITETFETEVGKGHRFDDPDLDKKMPSMHMKVRLHSDHDKYQYHDAHLIICGPCNYVYVARQDDLIDNDGAQEIRPLEILGYHDSCWRDAIDRFLWDNKDDIYGMQGGKIFDWYEKIELSLKEVDYLGLVEKWRRERWSKDEVMSPEIVDLDPIKKRWIRS